MASGATLPVFPEFDLRDQTNLATRWEKYMKRFNNLMAAMDVKEESRKRALLLHYSGEEVNDLFDTLPDTGEDNDYKEACEALTRYFTPKKNVSFEIFKFRNLKQESHETVDEFHTRLQIASKYCKFGDNKEKEIKAQIELGTSNKKLRRYSFRTPGLTLTQLLDYARTLYETERQAKGIEATNHVITSRRTESEHADIHKIQINKQRSPNPRTNKMSQHSKRKPAATKIYLQNTHLNVVFAVVTRGHTTMASVLLRARSVITAPNTTILPVCVTPKIKLENNSTRIPPMQYGMIFDRHIPITTVTAAVTKAPTATRMPLLLMKFKTSPTQERNNARSMQT